MADPSVKVGDLGNAPIIPILLILSGGYLAWFGVHYWREDITWPSDPIKSVLQGKGVPPQQPATTSADILSAAEGSVASSGGGGTSGGGGSGHVRTVGGGASQTAWSKSLLASLAVPQTSGNVSSINAWQQREGGGGQNNPLNTTWPMPGATDFNSVGVKNYSSIKQGLEATVLTLHGGGYNDILMYLRSGHGFVGITLAGLSRWSGGGYSSV